MIGAPPLPVISSGTTEAWFSGQSWRERLKKRCGLACERDFGSPLLKQYRPRPMESLCYTPAFGHTPPIGGDCGRWALDWASVPNSL